MDTVRTVKQPSPLTADQLRKKVDDLLAANGSIRESNHTSKKHADLTIIDSFLSLKDEWLSVTSQWDAKREIWRYAVMTKGMTYRPVKTVFTFQEEATIFIITRHRKRRFSPKVVKEAKQ